MSGLYLEEGEEFVVTTHRISVNFTLYDMMLTTSNLVLIDSSEAGFNPWKIPLRTVAAVHAGKIVSGEPVITLSFVRPEGEDEEPRPLNLLFTQNTGEQRRSERDEWIKNLMEQIVVLRQGKPPLPAPRKKGEETPAQMPRISATRRGIDIPRPHSSAIREEPVLVNLDVVPEVGGGTIMEPVSPQPVTVEEPGENRDQSRTVEQEPGPEPSETIRTGDTGQQPSAGEMEPKGERGTTITATKTPAVPEPEKPEKIPEKPETVAHLPESPAPAPASKTQAPPVEPAPTGPPPPAPPETPGPSLRAIATAALVVIILLAVAAGVWYIAHLAPGGSDLPLTTTTPVPTPETTQVIPTGTATVTLPATTTTTVPAQAPVGIPANGIWLIVSCNESYIGHYGRPGNLADVSGEGRSLYRIPGDTALFQASFQKKMNSGSELTVQVSYNGNVVLSRSTRAPMGTIEFLIDPRTGEFPGPTPTPALWTGFEPGETYRV